MGGTIKRLAMHYVFVLVFLVQWHPAFPAPAPTSCDLNNTLNLRQLVEEEVNELLGKYIEYHGPKSQPVPEDVPDSTVLGTTVTEKLQDTCTKNMLFSLHISQVEAYQNELLPDPKPLLALLSRSRLRLSHFLVKVKDVLQHINLEIPELTTPAPLQLSHNGDYAKKVYGWGVIVRLEDWLKEVLLVLQEAQAVCH